MVKTFVRTTALLTLMTYSLSLVASPLIDTITVKRSASDHIDAEVSLRSKRTGFLSFLFKTKEVVKKLRSIQMNYK